MHFWQFNPSTQYVVFSSDNFNTIETRWQRVHVQPIFAKFEQIKYVKIKIFSLYSSNTKRLKYLLWWSMFFENIFNMITTSTDKLIFISCFPVRGMNLFNKLRHSRQFKVLVYTRLNFGGFKYQYLIPKSKYKNVVMLKN